MERKMRNPKKVVAFLASVTVLFSALLVTTGVLAYLHTGAYEVKNTFVATGVPNHVDENITTEKGTKNDVKIQNDGDIDAYVRAAVVVNWVNASGEIYYIAPVEGVDYELTWTPDTDSEEDGTQTNWIKGSDGYYYHKAPVAPGNKTDILLTKCKETDNPVNKPASETALEDYYLSVEILAQTIQMEGADSRGTAPVLLAWGTTTENPGSVESVENNLLIIQTEVQGGN